VITKRLQVTRNEKLIKQFGYYMILATSPIAKYPSMAGKNLHDNCLHLLTCHLNRVIVLIVLFHYRPKSKPARTSVEYLHKSFDGGFVKDHVIST
jgi:hypothetical protein